MPGSGRRAKRLAAALCALLAMPAAHAATADSLTASTGQWVRLFAVDVERLLGYSVRIDRASLVASGTVRSFREAEVVLNATDAYPRGTTLFLQRTVDCAGGSVVTTQWQVVGPTGAVLGGSATAGQAARVAWDTADGKVLRYICSGVLPR